MSGCLGWLCARRLLSEVFVVCITAHKGPVHSGPLFCLAGRTLGYEACLGFWPKDSGDWYALLWNKRVTCWATCDRPGRVIVHCTSKFFELNWVVVLNPDDARTGTCDVIADGQEHGVMIVIVE
ncbi:hypothetical protein METBIDRAFT_11673 [Metschnikowia bicuspidata var. bicuspidata NRRL YB-4993]|uniref:Secreted protein n=1 Tax=Metschnikowia bicuspidata var. bicuspidata NRRL YB-4993 TaxID=869754 RepID=A0A1A0HB37_9ASCO|nr:hypothetical protein METBIDRAFT_11673 [Metschnikowia bicuspidata var. bicuspidata NRRL YB-4993]OBA21103.1 hypothetical protein METBIDRAFT_11673 [Metschnikowia bicuspidata var. bicuspidata NRRL YB-4993]